MKDYSNIGKMGVCIELKNNNYGSMLQSYATQIMLKKYNIHFDLISYKKKYTPFFVIKSIPRLFNRVVWQDKLAEREKRKFISAHPEVKESLGLRKKAYDMFRDMYFTAPNPVFYGYNELVQKSKKYSTFLTGSDQLWSPSGLPTNFYNLMFTEDNAVRISYASSFGVKQIPWYQYGRTKKYLERIQFISCRETSGADIVQKLTGRTVPVVSDPTMLFDCTEWNEMLPCDRVQEGKYIFSYILGTNREHREAVLKLSKKTGLPIVSIHQYVEADLGFGDVSIENAGPAEFVDLIRNAEYICTDSFHGSVFSILYSKKFVVFNRYLENNRSSKNTRIENLCECLGVSHRRYSGDIVKDMELEIDYNAVKEKLNGMRMNSRAYLESAFEAIS